MSTHGTTAIAPTHFSLQQYNKKAAALYGGTTAKRNLSTTFGRSKWPVEENLPFREMSYQSRGVEPAELEEFLTIVKDTFQVAYAVYLEDLHAFSALLKESLIELSDRFDEVALPLLIASIV